MIDTHRPSFDELSDIARTLGHPHRLLLLRHIAEGEQAVERLVELSGLPLANASQHLQNLKRAGLVRTRRDGKRVLYRLGSGPIEPLLAALDGFARHRRKEIRELIADSASRPDTLENISREELLRRLHEGEIVLLDVRPHEEYVAGHLPGALNIPADELQDRLSELPRDKTVVAYCRGAHCVLSADALAILRTNGWAARRFEGGLLGWRDARLEIEASGPGAR